MKPRVMREEDNRAIFEIDGLYPGYGQTIGNSIRRVLFSSLKGAAITSVKINNVGHEFSTLEGVMEDMVDLILNLKQVRFRIYEEGPFTITLSVAGEKNVNAGDFKMSSQVEVVNKHAHIATLTSKKAMLEIEATVESGLGYVPVESRSKDKVEVGVIALDAAFSPVRHVNYEVENMRVGDRTDFNRLRLHVETDGSLTPEEAFNNAVNILMEQFSALSQGFEESSRVEEPLFSFIEKNKSSQEDRALKDAAEEEITAKIPLEDVKLSSRTINALREAGIKTIGGVSRKREEALREIAGIGDKGIQEIKKALGNFGITLKQ